MNARTQGFHRHFATDSRHGYPAVMHLGIDIGGTSVKVAACDSRGNWATGASDPYSRPDTRALIVAIRSAVDRVRTQCGHTFAASPVHTVGLAVPGILDEARGEITTAVNVPGLVGAPLKDLVSSALGQSSLALRCFTDAHAAGLDVMESETPRLTARLLAISLGTGVGACVLDDGVPVLISGRSPGHLGHIDVTIHEHARQAPLGPDGGRGGLEAYIGLPALVARLGCTQANLCEKLAQDPVPLLALARAIRIAHAIYRPQHIRLVGGVGIQLKAFLPALQTDIARDLTSLARPSWTLACGESVFHAAKGAARGSAPPH
jgi:predicted NBD/HSP70 family sugar kinase